MTDAAGDGPNLSAWSTRLYAWGDRARRFNKTRLTIVALVGGLAGLALSITAGTTLIWLIVGSAMALMFIAMLIFTGKVDTLHTGTPPQWTALTLAPFFNQIAFVAPELYLLAVTGIVIGLLIPLILHGLGWLFWRLSPAMP